MVTERRKYVRFLAHPKAFAVLGNSFTRIGRIVDISMGGLAFEYYCGAEDSNLYDTTVTIFITVNNFYLENIPSQVISDRPKCGSTNKPTAINSKCRIKRCGIQFTNMSEEKRQRIEYFLNNQTRGIAPSLINSKNRPEFA
jgi:hypothetical protein